ncbi:hypothetical protein ETB97_001332 [Aspergillus alliaceus]|uniref:Uncharacterized protein n=1 Tax=Petromyces alliaceus TaxID=209559 RepID=A0A8H6E6T6_PETAA|nr:hypothetical protein ETB97_001332 [Aspergillus burnettii]
MAGFSWREEVPACVDKLVPYKARERDEEAQRPLQEGQAAVCLLHCTRRQPIDWEEPQVGYGDREEGRRRPQQVTNVVTDRLVSRQGGCPLTPIRQPDRTGPCRH